MADELTIDIQLRAAGCSLAASNIRLPSDLKLEPKLMFVCRHGVFRFNLQVVSGDIVVYVVQLSILHIEGKATVITAERKQRSVGAALRNLNLRCNGVGAV